MNWGAHPWLSLTLLVVWLLLVQSFTLGQVLLGGVLALLIPRFTAAFWPERPRVRHPLALLRYLGMVAGDIIVANLEVARLILGSPHRLRPAFVELTLELEDPFAIAVLASTISLTPGTVSADLSLDRRRLLVHGLDVADPAAFVAHLKARYEAPLKEIFS